MDQRPDFDHGQNDQEITNDEKLGLVEIINVGTHWSVDNQVQFSGDDFSQNAFK